MDQHWWMIKFGLWIFLGAAPMLVKRKILPPWMALTLCISAGVAAAWLGVYKPL